MKMSDLISESSVPANVTSLVKALTMSMSANGQSEISTDSIRNEVKKRFNMDISYGDLMNILGNMPFISDSNDTSVQFSDGTDTGAGEESSADKVAQMATKGAHAVK